MRLYGTITCIKCGKPAFIHAGHLISRRKMALGNYTDIKILSGWCSEKCHDVMEADQDGCFSKYDNTKYQIKEVL